MTYDDMKALLKDVAQALREKEGPAVTPPPPGPLTGAAAVETWLAYCAENEARDALMPKHVSNGLDLLKQYGELVRPRPWVGVDFDCTLAEYDGNFTKLGDPIPRVMGLVRDLLFNDIEVRIFTARAAIPEQVKAIQDWCEANRLPRLRVTATKDFNMICLVDDRAIHVSPNDGTFHVSPKFRSLHPKIAKFL